MGGRRARVACHMQVGAVAYVLLKRYKGDSKLEEWFELKLMAYRSGGRPDISGPKEFP